MVKITDLDSAEEWLKGRPREVQVTFAARSALRALPGIGDADPETLSDIALPVLRAMLISGVASTRPTPEIRKAALSAASALSAAAARSAASADAERHAGRLVRGLALARRTCAGGSAEKLGAV